MGEVIEENDLARHIRYRHTITAANWSNETNLWTIDATRIDTGERLRFTTNFFWMCQGYYRHDAGYTPEWTDMAKFKGTDRASADLARRPRLQGQARGRDRLGATAATLIPAMAKDCRPCHHAAALADLFPHRPQRDRDRRGAAPSCRSTSTGSTRSSGARSCSSRTPSPSGPSPTPEARQEGPAGGGRAVSRQGLRHRHALHAALPAVAAAHRLRSGCRPVPGHQESARPPSSPTRSSASPRRASCSSPARSSRPTSSSPRPASTSRANGGIEFAIDGKPLDFKDTVTYRGMMFTGVPNLVWVFGYFRASWTLRVDLGRRLRLPACSST